MTSVQSIVFKRQSQNACDAALSKDVPCDHCGLPTTAIRHNALVFCCHGCMGAYSLIHEMGLDDYYSLRNTSSHSENLRSDSVFLKPEAARSAVDLLVDLESAGVKVRTTPEGFCEVRLGVEGIHCNACSWLIERLQTTMDGVQATQVRMSDRSVKLVYDPATTNPAKISKRLSEFGYLLVPFHDDQATQNSNTRQQHEHLVAIAVAAFLAANAMWIGIALYAGEATGMSIGDRLFFRWIGTILGLLSAIFPGRVFFRSAIQALRSRTAHVDIPVALALGIGTLGSVWGSAIGRGHIYFDSLASLVLLLRIGRYIQFRSQYRTGLSLSKLFRGSQSTATRIEPDGTAKTVATTQLKTSDIVLVQPGQVLPADGFVIEGKSHLNVSWLTGESLPISVSVSDQVVGGTLNIDSPIRIQVTECGQQSRMGQLEEVIRDAAGERTPLVRIADKLGRWFVIVVLGLAVVCWCSWFAVANIELATLHTIALLTIACPCAIALAAPLVITVTIGRAARNQIWIRDGESIERLAKPGIVWFDKTGTLTTGELQIDSWHGSKRSVEYAAAVESQVNHPLAKAIARSVLAERDTQLRRATSIRVEEGLGVEGFIDDQFVLVGSELWMQENGIPVEKSWLERQSTIIRSGHTPVWVAIDGVIEGIGAVGDSLRPDTIQTLRSLENRGWKIGILSGDRQEVVDYWRDQLRQSSLEFYKCLGGCSPESKATHVRASSKEIDGTVVFVGDGINDAVSLAIADVGIAIRGGSDIGLRAAPIYLASNRLASVLQLLQASASSVRSIQYCFAMSLIYNAITLSLAMMGLIHPLIAAILMPISGLTVLTFAIARRTFPKEANR
ncbi:MAG: heavy metal translocating P-type ATPase [Pirellulaceae bacterium]|nr:heavy metal translocating P-type ATPase [Pirellulaceae bacterium]